MRCEASAYFRLFSGECAHFDSSSLEAPDKLVNIVVR